MQPDLIITPFGESADPATIRDIPKTNPSGSPKQNASWSSGFPIVTMTPISQGGIPPEGPDLNGVLRAISRHSAFVGGGGQYKWSSDYVTANGGYPKGAVIQSDDGLVSYVSAIDGNSGNFNSDSSSIGTSWLFFGGPGSYFELEFEKEMQGFQDLFNTFLTNTAFEMPPIPFTEGSPIEISRPTQLVSYEGNLYSVKLPSSFPAILSGMWEVAQASLTLQTDRALRQQLASTTGPSLIAYRRAMPSGKKVNDLQGFFDSREVFVLEFADKVIPLASDPDNIAEWDWAPAIQAGNDYIVSTGYTGSLVMPSFIPYKIKSGVVLDTYYCSIKGDCLIDATEIATGPAIKVVCSSGQNPSNSYSRKGEVSGGIRLQGPGRNSPGSIGILFDSSVALSNAAVLASRFAVYDFATGHAHSNRAYNSAFDFCEIFRCGTCVDMLSGSTDAGEKVVYTNSKLYNSLLAVKNSNPNGALHLIACSLDYNVKQVEVNAGRAFLDSCHIEARNYPAEPFSVGPANGATLTVKGGWVLCSGTGADVNTVPVCSSTTTVNGGGGALFDSVFMNNMGTSQYFASGTGRCRVKGTFSFDIRDNPRLLSAASNLLLDGTFESGIPDACIRFDTAAITSKTVGANINLVRSTEAFRSGAASLKMTKTNGSGSSCAFMLYVPIDREGLSHYRGYYSKTGAQTGNMIISSSYARIEVNSSGVPTIQKVLALGSITKTFTAAAEPWTLTASGEPSRVAPPWATHYVVIFDFSGMNAGSVYFDDFEITSM